MGETGSSGAPPDATVFLPRGLTDAAPDTPAEPLQIQLGVVLNGIYRINRLIARGGMGEVFEGANINDDQDRVAIKLMLPSMAADAKVQALFRREARVLTRIIHPAVVQYRVLAHEPKLGLLYIVTEYIDGAPLSEVLTCGPPPASQLRILLKRLAEGLRASHELGAVHRDLSPDNILLPEGRMERAKIIDYGITKDLSADNKTIIGDGFAGKIGFVAPEQFGDFGGEIGPWTDVYSLGLVIVSVALGRPVDMGANLVEAVDRRRAGPDLACVPAELRPVVRRMLIADPARRLRSMDAVLGALESPKSHVAGPRRPPWRPASPSPRMLALGTGMTGLVVLLMGMLFLAMRPAHHAVQAAPPLKVDAPPRAARARQAIVERLASVPCSWISLTRADDTASGVAVKLVGVALSPSAAGAAVNQALSGAGVTPASLDLEQVGQIGQPLCSALDSFRSFQTDGSDAGPTLSSAQTEYVMHRNEKGALESRAVIAMSSGDPRRQLAFVGIEESGATQVLLASRAELSALLRDPKAHDIVAQTGPDLYRLSPATLNQGWSGLLLITASRPIEPRLFSATVRRRDDAWQARLRQAAQAGDWKADMVWYRSVAPGP